MVHLHMEMTFPPLVIRKIQNCPLQIYLLFVYQTGETVGSITKINKVIH